MIDFIEQTYPAFASEYIINITEEEFLSDNYTGFRFAKDFAYEKSNSNVIKALMAEKKTKNLRYYEVKLQSIKY